MSISKLYGKIIFEGQLELLTGMHISTSNEFAAIGAVDTIVIRDPYLQEPIIPGSSLKGKMRYLASRISSEDLVISAIKDEADSIKRLFGNSKGDEGITLSRLNYYDLKINRESIKKLKKLDLDLPYTEIKFENTINRITGVANPRQLERVIAGTVFDFKLVYNIENLDEVDDDLKFVHEIMDVLEDDYIGGHGTRGYGKIKFNNIDYKVKKYSDFDLDINVNFNE